MYAGFIIISVITCSFYIGIILYYRAAWTSLPFFDNKSDVPPCTSISVIIPARNEENNISHCLQSAIAQNYPRNHFEIIVVDDHSTDKTAEIVSNFSEKNVRLISLSEHLAGKRINSYKKKAIETGISVSAGQLIVTTDADCRFHINWLRNIARFYEKHKPLLIAAPVSIDCDLNFLEIFQALDFMTLQGITGGSVHKKKLSMCNGANLAYEKDVFYKVGGFENIDGIASGDDMLLMHKIFTAFPNRVMFLKSREAIVLTEPVRSVKDFFRQRIRWASKADKYEDKRIIAVLALVYVFNLILLVMPVSAIFINQEVIPGRSLSLIQFWGLLLFLKTIAELFFLWPVALFFRKQPLLFLFPFMQPFHILYTIIAGTFGKFGRYEWKGRQVK